MISVSEGTASAPDPYRVCYGKKHVIVDLTYHPAEKRPYGAPEWGGETLTDQQCINAGFSPGCKSTAAGRYQITRPTWERIKVILGLQDFTAHSQDDACVQLLKECKALDLINAGRVAEAITACRHEWASLPGNAAGQPQTKFADLIQAYGNAGGAFA
jgi:muramidase (phage lysozyme)